MRLASHAAAGSDGRKPVRGAALKKVWCFLSQMASVLPWMGQRKSSSFRFNSAHAEQKSEIFPPKQQICCLLSLIYAFKYYSLGRRPTTTDSWWEPQQIGGIVKPVPDSFDARPLIRDENWPLVYSVEINWGKLIPATVQGLFFFLLQKSSSRWTWCFWMIIQVLSALSKIKQKSMLHLKCFIPIRMNK